MASLLRNAASISAPACGDSGTTRMPSVSRVETNQSNSSRRLEHLGDDADLVAASGEPRAREVPAPEVREREHDALARRRCPRRCAPRPARGSAPAPTRATRSGAGTARTSSDRTSRTWRSPRAAARCRRTPARRPGAGCVRPAGDGSRMTAGASCATPRASGAADRSGDDADDLGAGPVREVRGVPDAFVQPTGDGGLPSARTRRGAERPPASRSARVCGRWAAHHCASPPACGSSRSAPRA